MKFGVLRRLLLAGEIKVGAGGEGTVKGAAETAKKHGLLSYGSFTAGLEVGEE